jgi:hypothetical protein
MKDQLFTASALKLFARDCLARLAGLSWTQAWPGDWVEALARSLPVALSVVLVRSPTNTKEAIKSLADALVRAAPPIAEQLRIPRETADLWMREIHREEERTLLRLAKGADLPAKQVPAPAIAHALSAINGM